MSVTVKFDKEACIARIKNAAEGEALFITSKQVLKDSNKYCPKDQGTLISSSLTNSQPEKGKLVWKTPYARHLYYGIIMVDPLTGKACFPIDDGRGGEILVSRKGVKKEKSNREFHFADGRQKLWCHYAKSKHLKEWQKAFDTAFKNEMRKK